MSWTIKELGFQQEKIIHHGNQFLIGHLLLGVRGTLDEFRKDQLVAINLPFVYDQVGEGWREPVNAFNPLYTTLFVNHKEISLLTQDPTYHEQCLDMKHAVMSRKTIFSIDGVQLEWQSSRFVSINHERLMVTRTMIKTDQPMTLTIKTGIDQAIWDIHGPHLEHIQKGEMPYLSMLGSTHEKGYHIHVLKHVIPHQKMNTYLSFDEGVYQLFEITTQQNQTYIIDTISIIGVDQTIDELTSTLHESSEMGFDQLLKDHESAWEKKWEYADIKIKGDDNAERALRYSIYHLLLLSPNRKPKLSIPARGISGQTYKGAIFWDTEIFMLPFYLNTDPLSARHIIEYRIEGLQGAKEKAAYYGYQGAFYAWESQENGYDACTDYNVTDVFTHRKVRTYFKDKQIHISGDIVYAINRYIHHTQDYTILSDGALEIFLEVGRFYLDYGQHALLKDRFELKDVMGPDEYHERVHNNAFTNQLVHMVFETILHYESDYHRKNDPFFDDLVNRLHFHESLELIRHMVHKIYIQPIHPNGLIEQFDGYFMHRDIAKKELLDQKLHPHEYLGGAGLAGDTQIIKQADVITMLYLFKDRYDQHIIRKNWAYYEPRTEHGSSLSASMYALTSCMIGNPSYAYPLFMKSASIDLTGESKHYAGGVYIGGTHPAASGGAYMTAVYGFAGLNFTDHITLNPKLPPSFESLSFQIKYRKKQYKIDISQQDATIQEVLT